MTSEDATELIGLCDRAIGDLKRFDTGTSYTELQIAGTFRTIVEPLLQGGDLEHEFRRTIPAADRWNLKAGIAKLKNGNEFPHGKAFQTYSDSVLDVKRALERYVEKSKVAAASEAPDAAPARSLTVGFEDLLHPAIVRHSLPQFRSGNLRNAVLDGVTAVFDMIRARTGLDLDGKALVTQAFSLQKGSLIFSDLESESGKNDQVGFMQIFEGIYTGVRNPKAHTLDHDLNVQKAGQYLVILSLLARRVDESKLRTQE